MKDGITFGLCLLAAIWAENLVLLAVLLVAALAASRWPARPSGHYYRVCPYCGAHLDPGELCDCQKESRPSADDTEAARWKRVSAQTEPFRPYFTGAGEGSQE